MKKPAGEWCIDAKSKADHLADTFKSKFKLSQNVTNCYTGMEPLPYRGQTAIAEIIEDRAEKVLLNLRSDSATGPDQLPTRIIKECAKELAKPFCMLAKLILIEARWPELWTIHSIVPLYKESSVYSAMNYRGVHLTAQLSKAMVRFLGALFMSFLLKTIAFGSNQFAYTPERGARDVLAHIVLTWLTALAKGSKIAVYCSDVSGASRDHLIE